MTVRGFTIDPRDPTVRRPMEEHGSKEERAHCECMELTNAGFFEEAMEKFWEYCKHNDAYKLSARDYMLLARIQPGAGATTSDVEFFDKAIGRRRQLVLSRHGQLD